MASLLTPSSSRADARRDHHLTLASVSMLAIGGTIGTGLCLNGASKWAIPDASGHVFPSVPCHAHIGNDSGVGGVHARQWADLQIPIRVFI